MDPFHLPGQCGHPQLSHKMEPWGSRLFVHQGFHLLELAQVDARPQRLTKGFLGRIPGRIGFHAVSAFFSQ